MEIIRKGKIARTNKKKRGKETFKSKNNKRREENLRGEY